jgi:hypothetical protein
MESASYCLTCNIRSICVKICDRVEKLLPKPRSGGHWKEFSTDNIDEVAVKWAFHRKGGKKKAHIYSDNYELT